MLYQSTQIDKLAPAFIRAQAAVTTAKKESWNPFNKNWYADLAAVLEAAKPALEPNGLAVIQFPSSNESGHYLDYLLMHESGQFIGDRFYFTPKSDGLQDVGAAITYGRRYTISALLGIASEDPDAAADEDKPQPQAEQSTPAKPKAATSSDKGGDKPARAPRARPAAAPASRWTDVVWDHAVGKTPMGDLYQGHTLGWIYEHDRAGFLDYMAKYATDEPINPGDTGAAIVKALTEAKKELASAPVVPVAEASPTPKPAVAPTPSDDQSQEPERDRLMREAKEVIKRLNTTEEGIVKFMIEKGKAPASTTMLDHFTNAHLVVIIKGESAIRSMMGTAAQKAASAAPQEGQGA